MRIDREIALARILNQLPDLEDTELQAVADFIVKVKYNRKRG